MKLIELWKHGDQPGIEAAEARARKAQRIVEKLRQHREENHLGEHIGFAFREPKRTP